MRRAIIYFLSLTVSLAPTLAIACVRSPFPPPPICEQFWDGDAVALVEVTYIQESNKDRRRKVTLRVIDIFRGDPPRELTIEDPWTDCGVNFGKRGLYLTWLFHENNSWTAYGDRISLGSDRDSVNKDLQYAQSMKNPPSTGRIFGTLDKLLPNDVDPVVKRRGSIVVAKGPNGTFQSAVSPDLSFDISGVASGKYVVTVSGLPTNLSVTPEEVEVYGGGCREMRLFSGSSSEINGKVFGGGATPVASQVHLIPMSTSYPRGSDEVTVFADAETGTFAFRHVAPGRYVLGFELGHSPTHSVPYASRYYPDTRDISLAKIFEVKEGQQINDIKFDLGHEVPRRLVRVRVTWGDGSPVHRATAYLRDAHNPNSSVVNEQTETDANGEALLEGFIDTDYDVDANAVCEGTAASRDIEKKVISAAISEAFVELRVPERKCTLKGNRYLE